MFSNIIINSISNSFILSSKKSINSKFLFPEPPLFCILLQIISSYIKFILQFLTIFIFNKIIDSSFNDWVIFTPKIRVIFSKLVFNLIFVFCSLSIILSPIFFSSSIKYYNLFIIFIFGLFNVFIYFTLYLLCKLLN